MRAGECNGEGDEVFLGIGDGTCPAPGVYGASLGTINALALADVNADGMRDLVATSNSGVSVLLGNGDGTFQSPLTSGTSG